MTPAASVPRSGLTPAGRSSKASEIPRSRNCPHQQPGPEPPAKDRTDLTNGDAQACFGPDPVSEVKHYPRYPEGSYEAECTGTAVYRDPGFKRWTARLEFRILPGGEMIYGFLNLGSGEKPSSGRRSKYFRAWVIANGDGPRKRQQLSHRVFKGKCFEVRIADTKRDCNGDDHPSGAVYSTVKEIIRRTYP
jgi:hypothetical protein